MIFHLNFAQGGVHCTDCRSTESVGKFPKITKNFGPQFGLQIASNKLELLVIIGIEETPRSLLVEGPVKRRKKTPRSLLVDL